MNIDITSTDAAIKSIGKCARPTHSLRQTRCSCPVSPSPSLVASARCRHADCRHLGAEQHHCLRLHWEQRRGFVRHIFAAPHCPPPLSCSLLSLNVGRVALIATFVVAFIFAAISCTGSVIPGWTSSGTISGNTGIAQPPGRLALRFCPSLGSLRHVLLSLPRFLCSIRHSCCLSDAK